MKRSWPRAASLVAVLSGIFVLLLTPPIDPDMFWHLAAGRYMVAVGHVPLHDPFTWTFFGRPWITHEWASEWLMYHVWTAGGYVSLSFFFAAVVTATIVVVYATARVLGAPSALSLVCGIITLLVIVPVYGARPAMLSLLLLALLMLLYAISVSTRYRRAILAAPLLFLIWVNLHGGFLAGLVVLTLLAISHTILARTAHTVSPLRPRAWWSLLAGSTVACLLSPYGWTGLLYPLTYLHAGSERYIAEWQIPHFTSPDQTMFNVLCLLIGATFLLAEVQIALPRVFLLIAWSAASLAVARNEGLFAVISSPLLAAAYVPQWSRFIVLWRARYTDRISPAIRSLAAAANLPVSLAATVLLVALAVGPRLPSAAVARAQGRSYPQGAVIYLARQTPCRLFNPYEWGGYLLWTLPSRWHVYIDGRDNVPGFVAAYRRLAVGSETDAPLRAQHVGDAVVPIDGLILNQHLRKAFMQTAYWHLVYRDRTSLVYRSTSSCDNTTR